MYFAKYLKQLGYEPIIITVDETKASYPVIDSSLIKETNDIRVIKTSTREPLRWYSILISGDTKKGIPQGEVKTRNLFEKLLAFIRGNYFIPDARKGWIPFAVKEAKKILKDNIDKLHTMAEALLTYETIDADQIDDIMAGATPREPKGWSDDTPSGKASKKTSIKGPAEEL